MRLKGLLLVVSLLCFNLLYSQQPEAVVQVKKSTDKVKIEGKYYYIHIVREGQSLYGISKAYGVSQMEIAMDNPDIYLGIQVDQALKIPAKEVSVKGDDDRLIYHIVKKGETLFGLSKQYQVSIDDIIKVNPDVQSGLVLSQVLLIPRERLNTINQRVKKDSVVFFYHQVRPKEGLYSISKQYKVDIRSIEEMNQDVLSNGLKAGSMLKIPKKADIATAIPVDPKQDLKTTGNQISTQQVVYTPQKVKCDTFNYSKSKRIFNVSLLLPLLLDAADVDTSEMATTDANGKQLEKSNEPEKISLRSHNFLDFYQGFLLAVDSLKRDGLSLNISVYNTSKNVEESSKLFNEKGLKESDLIIGPIYPELLKPFGDFSKENRINLVSPLSQNDNSYIGNPYLFQVNPPPIVLFDEFVSKVDFCSDNNLMFVYEDDSATSEISDKYKELVKNRIKQCENFDSIHFKELLYKPGVIAAEIQDKLNQSMNDQKENIFIVPSESEAFVSDFLGHLFALATYYNYKIKVYGFPRWQRFKNVPIEYYYRLNLHLFTPFYVDYTRNDVKKFVDDYRHYYRAEASQYSFQGYDIGLYFLKAIKKYGVDFKYCLPSMKVNLLQSNFRFEQSNSLDGYKNKSIFLIHYTQDFDILQSDDQ